jgi:hypothetical protein
VSISRPFAAPSSTNNSFGGMETLIQAQHLGGWNLIVLSCALLDLYCCCWCAGPICIWSGAHDTSVESVKFKAASFILQMRPCCAACQLTVNVGEITCTQDD